MGHERIACLMLRGSDCMHPNIRSAVTPDRCALCKHYLGPMRGIGDAVRMLTRTTGIEAIAHKIDPNCRCTERQAALNRMMPFADSSGKES